MNYKNLFKIPAFTLAEVLITLGIIGVVAAMTIPTLMTNVQGKILESQLAKAKSIITNGYKHMLSHTETFSIDYLPFMTCGDNEFCMSREHKGTFRIVADSANGVDPETLPTNYKLNGIDTPSPFNWGDLVYVFVSPDGMIYGVEVEEGRRSFAVYLDVNGTKSPNFVEKDMFKFRVTGNVRMSDVSRELEGEDACSPSNLDRCDSLEACQSLSSRFQDDEGRCPGIWYDDWNGCNIWGWQVEQCR